MEIAILELSWGSVFEFIFRNCRFMTEFQEDDIQIVCALQLFQR